MKKSEETAKRIGRPPKGEGKRQTYNFRMNEGVRDKILAAANKEGRSISEEVEKRIIESTQDYDFLTNYFGGRETLNLILLISTAVRMSEVRTGRPWHTDIDTQRIVAQAIVNIGYVCRPIGAVMDDSLEKFVVREASVVSQASLQLLDPDRFAELNPNGEPSKDPRMPEMERAVDVSSATKPHSSAKT